MPSCICFDTLADGVAGYRTKLTLLKTDRETAKSSDTIAHHFDQMGDEKRLLHFIQVNF